MKSYLLTFDQSRTPRETFVKTIDGIRSIENWMFFFDNTACLISESSARELSDLIRNELPRSRFVVVDLEPRKRGGWLSPAVWTFIKEPKPISG